MVERMSKETSRWWWFDSHKSSKCSPWLHSTLTELDEMTKTMMRLVEEDGDSFAQRAEMYYKKRPELISMVEDFYRAYRSLAERYDLVKAENGTRHLATFGPPKISIKRHKPEKLMSEMDRAYNGNSETSDAEEYAESEVDDPEPEVEIQSEKEIEEVEDPGSANESKVDKEMKENNDSEIDDEILDVQELKRDVSTEVYKEETMKLREEIERLKEENKTLKDQLMQKDEEKREVIRQLSLSVGVLKDENLKLRKYIARDLPEKQRPFELSKLKWGTIRNLFSGSSKSLAGSSKSLPAVLSQ